MTPNSKTGDDGAELSATVGSTIRPSATRKADGWAPTLEYSNGGRVIGQQRCESMEDAVGESAEMIQCIAAYPVAFRSNHPGPNQLIDLSNERVD